MRTTVTAPIVHLCPHVDEVDVGTVTMIFDGPAPELHDLARCFAGFAAVKITHEDLTSTLADMYKAVVTTEFRTAGLLVQCTVGE